jgi:2-(1,2-epoxy-1,2-dihydrophenyl)acetyl-CoA isomerase
MLMGKVFEYANAFASGPTRAFAAVKRIYNSPTGTLREQMNIEAITQGELANSADFAEGVTAFLQKRTPTFVGK